MRRLKRTRLAILLSSFLLLPFLLPSVASAETLSPWWHVVSVSQPTNLPAGLAAEEIQEIKVTATGGEVTVSEPVSLGEALKGGGIGVLKYAKFPYNATHEEAQTALETAYGVHNVEVASTCKEPVPPVSECVYRVTFTGALSYTSPIPTPELAGFGYPDPEGLIVTSLHLSTLEGEAVTTQLSAGKPDGTIVVLAENTGDADVNATKNPVTITDVVPSGLKAVGISARVPDGNSSNTFIALQCTTPSLTCTFTETLPPYDQIEVRIPVVVEAGAQTGENVASISGGEAPSATSPHKVPIGETPAPFGVEDYELTNEEVGGALDAQAGSHPFQQTSTIVLNTSSATSASAQSSALAKDLNFRWPAGLIGNPTRFPQCTLAQFFTNTCPQTSVMGVATTRIDEAGGIGVSNLVVPLYNLEPAPGEPARLGFYPAGTPVFIGATVRTGEDYGITVHVENITQSIAYLSSEVTVWGVPGAAGHDAERGDACLSEARGASRKTIEGEHLAPCAPLQETEPPAFLTLPTACTGPLDSVVQGDSWREPRPPGEEPTLAKAALPALDGCNRLAFDPSIEVTPDGTAASTPTGLTVDEHVPQQSTLDANGLAEAAVKGLSVTLPEGVQINPSAGDGLLSCTEEQIGLRSPVATACPQDAKLATVRVKVPVLEHELTGAAYLATQNQNPFGSLVAMYVYAEDPISGVRIKAAGEVLINPLTGQLTAHFEADPAFAGQGETSEFLPDAPFEDVVLHFFGGERAPLATPARCGAYTTTGTFTPWSSQPNDEAAMTVHASSTFDITSGPASESEPNGTPCPGMRLPFNPLLTGGATNVNAGAFSPFTLTMTRKDGEQNLQSIEAKLPPGLSGILSNVELCPEPQANLGECPPNSLIGESTVSVGVGGDPFTVTGGKFYLTGPYNGSGACTVAGGGGALPGGASSPTQSSPGCAPFGITFEVPAKAGPFDLKRNSANPAGEDACDCVIVRGKIEINPITAAITITSDPPGSPYAIPTSIEGIPLEIQHINAITTRGNFQFNPTNCNKMEVTGTIHSSENMTDTIGVPFQVTNCAALGFKPAFKVTTSGKTSRKNGASLHVQLTYPKAPFGSQANIKSVKVDLPKQLPSRLTTLQKACPAKTFEANPAGCSAASIVGHAVAVTPLIPVPLAGPAYFVSYGGAKFPELVIVLQGYGVTLDLHGETFISKAGITSSTFHTVPDAPVGSFELNLSQGPDSALAANGSLCKSKLAMPTAFLAQNGAEIHESTKISVTGCPKTKKAKRKTKHHKKKK
jgi:hypothetical protein